MWFASNQLRLKATLCMSLEPCSPKCYPRFSLPSKVTRLRSIPAQPNFSHTKYQLSKQSTRRCMRVLTTQLSVPRSMLTVIVVLFCEYQNLKQWY